MKVKVFTEETEESYIRQKLSDLRDFGYPDLTLDEVRDQLEKVKKGEKLNVIGFMIKADTERTP